MRVAPGAIDWIDMMIPCDHITWEPNQDHHMSDICIHTIYIYIYVCVYVNIYIHMYLILIP